MSDRPKEFFKSWPFGRLKELRYALKIACFNFMRQFDGLVVKKVYSSTPRQNIKYTFLIPHYNSADFLTRCIDSIEKNTRNIEYDILIADDCSNKEEFEQLLKRAPSNTAIYRFDRNWGHSFMLEWLYHKATSSYVVCLDQDSLLISEHWEDLFREFEMNKKLLLIGMRDKSHLRNSPQMVHPSFILINKETWDRLSKAPLFIGKRPHYRQYQIGQDEIYHALSCQALAFDPDSIGYLDSYRTKYGFGTVGYYQDIKKNIVYHQWYSGVANAKKKTASVDGISVEYIEKEKQSFLMDWDSGKVDLRSVAQNQDLSDARADSMAKRLEVLLSCMEQSNMSIAARTNITTDAVIVNQCDKNSYEEKSIGAHKIQMVSCADRGLSKSRNKAIGLSTADICLLCDDDERLEDDYAAKILEAYEKYPDADLIAFKVRYPLKGWWRKAKRLGRLDILQICSFQITFRRKSIMRSSVLFNEFFGAGTEHSHGEENIFLSDCLNKGLKIYYVPTLIADVKQEKSTWFSGFTEKYFITRGIVTRYYMGVFQATLYAIYFSVTKFFLYRNEISFTKAIKNSLMGIYSKKVERPY